MWTNFSDRLAIQFPYYFTRAPVQVHTELRFSCDFSFHDLTYAGAKLGII